ncbi:hypothetical protein I5M27_06030 [Adhaeribacter sp. BT258]|uniref:RiboL-PSP-HEPN domain-containing protein n=1 Tax=Adhaeribacter terrigena TaxID=2793070 RepID=A0ABS1BZE4_9BACT|nr:hypothetical protein [Adhaeribacter terrigena]MBK0402535.1 hypothetical protein [Adhaeribacter terrigena]
MAKPLEKISKEYPNRGPLSQFRFEKSISFNCLRCGEAKTSKLITIYSNDWEKKLCNGCYGNLLSIYDIKGGQLRLDEKAEQLLGLLEKYVDSNKVREKVKKLNIANNKSSFLTPSSLRFYATSECVAETLTKDPNLDWSPAIIGLCKAFELELVELFINPLKEHCKAVKFSDQDLRDKDFGKIAAYCSGKPMKSPELGVVNHFIQTAVNSNDRFENSSFLQEGLKVFINKFPNHGWLINKNGLNAGIDNLTKNYRNKAAHTDELSKHEYESCKDLVFGENGIMWNLILSLKMY